MGPVQWCYTVFYSLLSAESHAKEATFLLQEYAFERTCYDDF